MKTINKILATLTLPLLVNSCDNYAYESTAQAQQTLPETIEQRITSTSYFDDFGKIKSGLDYSYTQMMVADLDNDGAIDLILLTDKGEVFAFQNKIPQKNKQ